MGHINEHIGVALIQVMNMNAFNFTQRLQQCLVGVGAVIARMGKQDQYFLHAGLGAPLMAAR
mgnify:CR=1 FL=1